MYWLVQLPDGQYRQVQAASGEQALMIVRNLYRGQYGATDSANIALASPTGASRPFDVAAAPPANFKAQDVGANTGPTNTNPTANFTDRNQGATQTDGPPSFTPPPKTPGQPITRPDEQFTPLNQNPNANVLPGTYGPDESFESAFRRALSGLGVDPSQSFLGRQIAGGSAPNQLDATYLARAATGLGGPPQGVDENRALEATIRQGGLGGLSNYGRQAGEAFNKLLGSGGLPAQNDLVQGFLTPDAQGMGNQANLALAAARGKYGGYFASNLLPGAGELRSRYEALPYEQQQPQGAGMGLGFLDYLRRRLGL